MNVLSGSGSLPSVEAAERRPLRAGGSPRRMCARVPGRRGAGADSPRTLACVARSGARVAEIGGGYGLSNVRVFGSVARGEDDGDSDVDFLVDVGPGVGLIALARCQRDLEALLGARVHLVRVRLIEIGEAVKGLPAEILDRQPEVPWVQIVGVRDRLAHRYFDTSHAILVATVEDLPELERAVLCGCSRWSARSESSLAG